jgi:hypothetical protein
VGKGKRADVYLEVRKRRDIYFFNKTSACGPDIMHKTKALSTHF